MRLKIAAIVCAGLVPLVAPLELAAQDAAETAVILSGSSGQGKASRSLGNAVRGSIDSATAAVRSSRRPNARRSRVRGTARRATTGPLPSNVDPLENIETSSVQLDNGSRIRFSGRVQPSSRAVCVGQCPKKAEQPDQEKPEE